LRVFVALPLPEAVVERLGRAGEELQRRARLLRVVRPAAMHITLIFFGELDQRALAVVLGALEDPSLAVGPIAASLGGLGQFPPRGAPRVLYCPIRRGAEEIRDLHRRLRAVLLAAWAAADPAGPAWDEGRPLTPHLTVARGRGAAVVAEDLEDIYRFEQPITLERLVLLQSILRPAGAEYRPLKTVHLTGERTGA